MSERNANIPSNFDRLAQGSAAREAMIARVRSMANSPVVNEPIQFSNRRSRRGSVFATGALGALSISAAALAACGGGSVRGERSNLTPDPSVQGIAGEQAPPGGGSSPIVVPTETSVVPTATEESSSKPRILTPEEVVEVGQDAARKIQEGFAISNVRGTDDNTDPQRVAQALTDCVNRYNDPRYQNRPDFHAAFMASCEKAARATKYMWETTHLKVFLDANGEIRDIHYTGFENLMISDPGLGLTEANWTPYETLDYVKSSQ
ncbi:TPA: hypothetical protein DIV55_06510 [Patescibacteria group bacterium]|uniref:Uncharacterized protein n=1 Tax=Candidatus Curtissbacteria bacterium GW2011_GWA1_40_16 TaxID=1618405 RepID=A0A0G0RLW0_9BACT|nr:MAG: hypothetical protein UT84_C0005G0032 [Candidatus Curtissbacteria bacterium GW2011_GWA1_40_16]HCS79356.1 hypothetical protein [Patescibacteria group bacterium]